MSDNGSNMQPVRPLTRREIREREQAAAAERAAQGGGAGAPASPGAPGAGRSAQPPSRPSGPPPSRRALRESTGPTEQASPPTVVRPPAASGGMRGLDETGRLTPVQETAERHTIRPPAPSPSAPNRTSARPAAGWQRPGAPGASGPVRPPNPSPGAFGAPGASPAARPAGPTGASEQPQRTSAFGGGQAAAPRVSASPWSTEQADRGAPASRQAPATPMSPARTGASARPAGPATEPAGPDLPWAAITSGAAPERATGEPSAPASPFAATSGTSGSPFAATAAGARSEESGDELFPRTGRDDAHPAEVDDSPRGPSYTWLHYLVLVAVAFVLGLLVWELISRDDPGPAAQAPPVSTVEVAAVDGAFAPSVPGR
ncbi:hypothetical protein [Cellulosimicrobium sp. NPDC057127]|uniref:hypothetical protein n=1 Tax=Cellulosimicrobium sp. NPDC057127 TaxID=3346026 RepID=UPI003632F475